MLSLIWGSERHLPPLFGVLDVVSNLYLWFWRSPTLSKGETLLGDDELLIVNYSLLAGDDDSSIYSDASSLKITEGLRPRVLLKGRRYLRTVLFSFAFNKRACDWGRSPSSLLINSSRLFLSQTLNPSCMPTVSSPI